MSEKYLKFCIYVILCSTVPPPVVDGGLLVVITMKEILENHNQLVLKYAG